MSFLNIHYTSGSVHDLIVTTPVHTLVVVQESLKKFTHTRTCELGPPIKMLHKFREDFLWQGDNYIEIHRTVTNFDTCALFWELINTAFKS